MSPVLFSRASSSESVSGHSGFDVFLFDDRTPRALNIGNPSSLFPSCTQGDAVIAPYTLSLVVSLSFLDDTDTVLLILFILFYECMGVRSRSYLLSIVLWSIVLRSIVPQNLCVISKYINIYLEHNKRSLVFIYV